MVLRSELAYAAYYCEENVWHLARDARLPEHPRFVVFMSNATRTCAVWSQRAAPRPGTPVIWDYHVVLIVADPMGAEVYDLDTTLEFPCPFPAYVAGTFHRSTLAIPAYAPRFRVIRAEEYLRTFASDRGHMLDASGVPRVPLPPWPSIRTEAESMNLDRFIDVESEFVGEITDLDGLCRRFS